MKSLLSSSMQRQRRFESPGRLLFGALLAVAAMPAFADPFTVDIGTDEKQDPAITDYCAALGNTAHCSLRAAIEIGNARPGSHTIGFSVPVVTVVDGDLPFLQAPFVIDGTHTTTIDGNAHGCLHLNDSGTAGMHDAGATGSQVLDLAIGNCSGAGISANGHDYTFSGNFIGVDATGAVAMANTGNGIEVSASIPYGDTTTGFWQTLYMGFPSLPQDDADIAAFVSGLAMAMASLEPVTISNNVIAGNMLDGVAIFSENIAAVTVENNMIGTDATGNVAIPNGANGVHLSGNSFGNLIGPGNVISGNAANGIFVEAGAVFLPNFIMGNRIGLSSTNASAHIGNALSGIVTDTSPTSPSGGHANPSDTALVIGPANVIADNLGADNADPDVLGDLGGIVITNTSRRVKVVGNTIGLAEFPVGVPVNSTAYGNAGDGIIITASGNSIGPGNVIGANARHGLVVSGSATASTSVFANSIGVSPAFTGDTTLGNGADGVHIDAASATSIGGPNSGDANTIVANARNGIKLRGGGGDANGWGNLFQGNSVYGNAKGGTGIDIDLEHPEDAVDGPHAENPANYANRDQAPVTICMGTESAGPCSGSNAPSTSGGNTTVQWAIDTHGPAAFRIDFFAVDASSTETATAMAVLGEEPILTDASGAPATGTNCSGGRCTSTLAGSTGGRWIVATATDVTTLTDTASGTGWQGQLTCFPGNDGMTLLANCNVNDTSEYSNVVAVVAAPPTVVTDAAGAITDMTASLNGTVSANGAVATVSFEYGATVGYGNTIVAAESPLPSDAIDAPVSAAISGLTCGTTVHFRATANNGIGGTVDGNDQTFTTAACTASAPTATTGIATSIAATSAVLNGTVSANGAQTAVTFDYGMDTTYAGGTLVAQQSPLSSGATGQPVAADVNGLVCATTYHFRVKASNVVGSVAGGDQTFATAPCAAQPPVAATTAASGITATTAVLNGTVTANGAVTTVAFDYGLTTAYGGLGSPLAATQSPLSSGAANAAVSVTVSGLVCNTAYHFRVNANNGVGPTVDGNDASFTTAACSTAPAASTTSASAITNNAATLNGIVSANGATTTVTFEYGTTTTYGGAGSPLLAVESPLVPTATNAPVSAALTGLACNTTYHVRVDANNGGGTVNGNDIAFTTTACPAGAPTVVTGAASSITPASATLNGIVSANGAQTFVTFEYGLTNAYGGAGSPMVAPESPLAPNASNAAVTAALVGLACNTTYHYRVDADNNVDSAIGLDQTFTTSACPTGSPSATTGTADNITATGATLNGTVSSNGAATTVAFEFGTTAAYGAMGSPIAAQESPLDAAATNAPVTAALSSLTCGTTYHFRVDADNGAGSVFGADQTFTTSACPAGAPTATTVAASAITASTATLNGLVSANGSATNVTFEYGATPAYGGAGSPLAAAQSPLPPAAINAPVSVSVTGLSCGATYHFRVDAGSSGGVVDGSDVTFTTSPCPAGTPSATSGVASAITATSATLNGTVSSNGATTEVAFDYGTTAAYGATGSPVSAAQSPLPPAASNASVSADLAGLTCGTLYHFRVTANNGTGGVIVGADRTFTTAACAMPQTTFSGPTVTHTGTATARITGGGPSCGFASAALVGAPASPPQGVTFPDGLFDFTTSGCVGAVTVTVTFPTAFQPGEDYWKFGLEPGQPSPHWYVLDAGQNLSLSGHVATFVLGDGEIGDDDGVANGTIRDPGGPGVVGGGGTGGGPGGDGAAPLPALGDAARALLATFILMLGACAVRRQRGHRR